jgi:hypothetical protein
MAREILLLVGVTSTVVVVLAILPANRRAFAVVLAERGERRRVFPWALSLAALLAGPLAPVVGVVVLLLVRKRAGLGDPLLDTARANGVVAVLLGLALLVLPYGLARMMA